MALSLAIHARLFLTLIIFFAGMAVWSFVNAKRRTAISQRYIGAMIVGELTLVLEGVLGLILLAGGLQPHQLMLHLMYGVAGGLVLPVAALSVRRSSPRKQHLVLAVICLLLCGLALRSQATGHIPGL